MSESNGYEGWAIVEMMGHQKASGRISEASIGGAAMLRIDIHYKDRCVTQYLSGGSIYRITPTTEEIARGAAESMQQAAPVSLWELRALKPGSSAPGNDPGDELEDEDGAF